MMLSNSQRTLMQTKGVVVGRVLLGLLFFSSGINMLMSGGDPSMFESLGLPLPVVLTWLVLIFKILAGGALILGKRVGCAAGLLAIFTLIATLIAHMDPNDPELMKNLAIIGGLLYVVAFGAGQWNATQATTPEPMNDSPSE